MLSDNIKKYRKLNNMSQDELAEKLEVTRQSISLWETGQTQPSLDNIMALSKLFNVTADDLLTEGDSKITAADSVNTPSKSSKGKYVLVTCLISVALILIGVLLWELGVFDFKTDKPENPQDVAQTIVDVPSNTQTIVDVPSNNNEPEKVPETNVDTPTDPGKTSQDTPAPATRKDLFGYLKKFVTQNGTVNGDYCYYSNSGDYYGGYAEERFSLYYWGDTDKIEFCVHNVIDDTFSINFYIYVPKTNTGEYEYISSYYYRDTGAPLYQAEGTIVASEFTKNYPLYCTEYIGSTDVQNDFMELSRQGICTVIDYLKEFVIVENLELSFSDFGFTSY